MAKFKSKKLATMASPTDFVKELRRTDFIKELKELRKRFLCLSLWEGEYGI